MAGIRPILPEKSASVARAANSRPEDAAAHADAQRFRLVSILAATAPSGCAGRDWLAYRIAQGENMITGYRRGDLQTVSAEVARIVDGLNDRRSHVKKATGRPGRPSAAALAARRQNEGRHE